MSEAAWTELLAATPPGWYVGQRSYHDARRQWMLYAFDPSEKAIVGWRQREWEAVANDSLTRYLLRRTVRLDGRH